MDSFEWNKIIGAVLGSLLVMMVVGTVADALVPSEPPKVKGYKVEGVEEAAVAAPSAPADTDPPVADLLAAADVDAGHKQTAKCASCHDFTKGGPARVGPNLWGIVGNKHGHMPGFAYSDAMKSHPGTWGYDELYQFIKDPQKYLPGSKMTFAGLKKPQDRANLIAYLRTLSDDPLPLPQPATGDAGKTAPQPPAEGGTADGGKTTAPAGDGTPPGGAAGGDTAPTTPPGAAPAPQQ